MNLKLRRVRGIFEQIIAPSYSACKRCWRPWKFVESHVVMDGPGTGYFEYCEECWGELPGNERPKDYYELGGGRN